jgi:bifunctional non-homologous end joining protein LigD
MSLESYHTKRDFEQTAEPIGKERKKQKQQLIFVVQRHKASRLHYDFRLEMEGVLKSWAVPKGPSLHSADKRLAMMVEDHPYDYKDFEGIIPEGNYGAGIVEIWDSGTYTSLANSGSLEEEEKLLREGLEAGNIKFILHGKKLKGEFALVRLKNDDLNSWLLIKHKDQYSVPNAYNSEDYTAANSPINTFLKGRKQLKGQVKKKP